MKSISDWVAGTQIRRGTAQGGDAAEHVGVLRAGKAQPEQRIVELLGAILENIDDVLARDVAVRVDQRARVEPAAFEDPLRVAAAAADMLGEAAQIGRAHLSVPRNRVERALQTEEIFMLFHVPRPLAS